MRDDLEVQQGQGCNMQFVQEDLRAGECFIIAITSQLGYFLLNFFKILFL